MPVVDVTYRRQTHVPRHVMSLLTQDESRVIRRFLKTNSIFLFRFKPERTSDSKQKQNKKQRIHRVCVWYFVVSESIYRSICLFISHVKESDAWQHVYVYMSE